MYTIKKGRYYVKDTRVWGDKSSYTSNIQKAVKYLTIEDAKRNLCPENERIVLLLWDM